MFFAAGAAIRTLLGELTLTAFSLIPS